MYKLETYMEKVQFFMQFFVEKAMYLLMLSASVSSASDGELMGWTCSSSKFHKLIICSAEACKVFKTNLMFIGYQSSKSHKTDLLGTA